MKGDIGRDSEGETRTRTKFYSDLPPMGHGNGDGDCIMHYRYHVGAYVPTGLRYKGL